MKANRKTKTDTPTQPTAEEHNALVRIHHATAGEDRWKCGLEYICNRLDDARGYAEDAAERILPDVADVKLNPVPTLGSLRATPPEWEHAVTLSELCEHIFNQLKKEVAIWPDVKLLCWQGGHRLRNFASSWLVFLYGWRNDGGCLAFMRKKIALAQTLGKQGAADKLTEAVRQLPPASPLTDFGDNDAARLADEITPDDFHVAFRNALKLDAEATAEINGEGKSTGYGDAGELEAQLAGLAPDESKTDAIQYCARLVCHVWNSNKHGGKRKSADHVFVKAKEGESLFCDCKYARTLVAKWGISVGGIMTVAAKIHAGQSGGKHTKADGMERPETMRQAAKKSRAAEQAERKQEVEHGARRSGKKR